jgi:hypothetical protein
VDFKESWGWLQHLVASGGVGGRPLFISGEIAISLLLFYFSLEEQFIPQNEEIVILIIKQSFSRIIYRPNYGIYDYFKCGVW